MNSLLFKNKGVRYVLGGLLFLAIACEDPVEGCLDIAATNFDPTADRDCCCEYPIFQIRFEHRAGESNLQLNQPYPIGNNDTIVFQKVAFYLSEITLFKEGMEYSPMDSFYIFLTESPEPDSVLSRSNVALITRVTSTSNMGSFLEEGLFERVRFRIGLNELMNQTNIEQVTAGTRLAIQADSMHTFTPEGYIFVKARVYHPATDRTVDLILTASDGEVFVDRNFELNSVAGFNKVLIIRVDYLTWLDGIDFLNYDEVTARNKFKENVPASLSLRE